jgi:hypothetical protein
VRSNALANDAGGRLVVDDFTSTYVTLLFLLDAVHDPLLELRSDIVQRITLPPSGHQRLMERRMVDLCDM